MWFFLISSAGSMHFRLSSEGSVTVGKGVSAITGVDSKSEPMSTLIKRVNRVISLPVRKILSRYH